MGRGLASGGWGNQQAGQMCLSGGEGQVITLPRQASTCGNGGQQAARVSLSGTGGAAEHPAPDTGKSSTWWQASRAGSQSVPVSLGGAGQCPSFMQIAVCITTMLLVSHKQSS